MKSAVLALSLTPLAWAEVADPAKHPYADSSKGREGYRLASEKMNEARLYDFYQRQADYYMAMPREKVPALLPAYPGLDGGKHGHWGKYSQNQHNDGRWNQVDHGPLVGHVYRSEKLTILKALCVSLGTKNNLCAAFDSQALSWRAIWQGGFVSFDPFRWGGSRNAKPAGELWFEDTAPKGWEGKAEGRFLGSFRDSENVILHYQIGDVRIYDMAQAAEDKGNSAFYRMLEFPEGVPAAGLTLRLGPVAHAVIPTKAPNTQLFKKDGIFWLKIGKLKKGATRSVTYWRKASEDPAVSNGSETAFNQSAGPSKRLEFPSTYFPHEIVTPGKIAPGTAPYVVDTVPVPFENPYQSVMQLTGIAFLPNGDALVTVWCGDVWKITNLHGDLSKVTWKRFATGFNQPIGVHIDDDGIFVLDRGRITRLEDNDGDGEADSYENYADDFGGYNRSHTHTFGLIRTADKAFHFVQRESVLRTSASPKTDQQALGVRNCMGAGLWQDRYYIAPQEGTWTPASMIIEVRQGEFYGHMADQNLDRKINPPLCYVPRGVDNSTGGMVAVESDKWGPLKGHFLGLSYGSGLHYLILRDPSGPRAQGATVPLEGEFRSGVMRGAFSPKDGQLYVVGMDGWGDYSQQDGCLNRVRYTKQPLRKPIEFQVHANGVRIAFSCNLDPKSATDPSNHFVHQWNYQYSKQYGSPEFSVKQPGKVGHDLIDVRSVQLLNKRTIFVEIPELVPSMQMHFRMHLKDAGGTAFKTDLFPTILQLGDHFQAQGLAKPIANKLTVLTPPEKRAPQAKDTKSGPKLANTRELLVEVTGGLQFTQKELRAKRGEALSLKLLNKDVMPHNLVLVEPGATREVGLTAFKMLTNPKAAEKHYVPDLPSVLTYTFVVPAGGSHVTTFRAPSKPGRYPYLCTFPGHWEAMQGVLIVE